MIMNQPQIVQPERSTLESIVWISNSKKVVKVWCDGSFKAYKIYQGQLYEYLKLIQTILIQRQSSSIRKNNTEDKIQTQCFNANLVVKYPFLPYEPIFKQNLAEIQINIKQRLLQYTEEIFRSEPLYFYSYENTFFDRYEQRVLFNALSTAGLLPIILKKSFTKEEFRQIFELLDKKMLEEAENRWNLVTYLSKFRAIAMFTLHLILGKRVTLLKESDIVSDEVSFQDTIRLLQKKPERFRRLLKGKGILEKIKQAEIRDKANYLLFFRRVFEDNCSDLEWKQVLSLLFSKYKPNTDESLRRCLKGIAQSVFKHEGNYVKEKLVLLGIARKFEYQYAQRQKNNISFQLIDYDLFLRILFQAASFDFQSVADQISQQKYYKTDNSSIFICLAKIINEMAAREQINNQDLQPLNLYVNNSINITINPTCTIPKPFESFEISKGRPDIQNYTLLDGECKDQITILDYNQTTILDSFAEQPQEMQQQSKKDKNSEVIPREHMYIVDKMAKLFKTNIAEVDSCTIKSLDRNMKIVAAYRQL